MHGSLNLDPSIKLNSKTKLCPLEKHIILAEPDRTENRLLESTKFVQQTPFGVLVKLQNSDMDNTYD